MIDLFSNSSRHLAIIFFNILLRLIYDWLDSSTWRMKPLWIGLSKDENGTWRWVNGDPATDETTFWGEGTLSAPSNNSCAVLSKEGFFTLTWNCSSTDVLFTCEIPHRD